MEEQTTDIAVREMKYEMANGEQMTLTMGIVRRFLVQGKKEFITESELMYFMHECKARQLNPFLRQCWLIKYSQNDNAQIVESIHHKRAKARRAKDCKGWSKGIIVLTKGGDVKDSHGLLLEGEKLLGGFFSATPEGWAGPWRLEVNLAAYIKKKADGKVTKFWAVDNQPAQIAKVAESQGLSALWGDTVGHAVIPGEIAPGADIIDMDMTENGGYEPPKEEPSKRKTFDDFAKEKTVLPNAILEAFCEKSAKAAGISVDELKDRAAKSPESFAGFWKAFQGTQDKPPHKSLVSDWTETDWEAWVGTWKSLAATFSGKSKTTQFLNILKVAPDSVKAIHREKWYRDTMVKHVKGEQWPLDPPEEPKPVEKESVEGEIVDAGFIDPGLQPPESTPGQNTLVQEPEPVAKRSVQELQAERNDLAAQINNRFAVGVVRHVMGTMNLEFRLQDNLVDDLKTRTLKEVKDIYAALVVASDDIPF